MQVGSRATDSSLGPLQPAVSCANELFTIERACPACEAVLDRPDDVVVSSLNPSADYRSVSGPTSASVFAISDAQDRSAPKLDTRIWADTNRVETSAGDIDQSVLAGLAPAIVMEIAARSLQFWQYQCSQEAAFQAMILRNAQEKNAVLEQRLQG
ncbi:uncharacterized protein PFL1_05896 [Pseudozyma flocculosa PF-1]|nr:uncharacterized protein PFL1_05896 [Pseudozyma flocculosa PF-1]EPQ26575.1 hypothetical protein PFL1_05896 [Pseudozyma flocculosa PF-1]